MNTFWNVNLPNLAAGYGRFYDSIAFIGYFFHILLHVWNDIISSNFFKLYVKAKCSNEKNVSRYLWLRQSSSLKIQSKHKNTEKSFNFVHYINLIWFPFSQLFNNYNKDWIIIMIKQKSQSLESLMNCLFNSLDRKW